MRSPPSPRLRLRRLAILLGALGALAACHRQSSPSQPAKPSPRIGHRVAAPAGPSAQQQTSDMVEAVTEGKSQAPIGLKFDLRQRPTEGEPLEVVIALLPQVAGSPATIEVSASEGLTLAPEEARFQFQSVEAAQVYRHGIKVIPTAQGLVLLTFSVSLQHDQSSDTRVFSVPILVGAAPGSSAAAPAAAHPAGAGTASQQASPAGAPLARGGS
ncbi:MAG TPA: hypothetical protein VME42_03630 [Steroidobacteraceae bacterium]|nr:hypothetical protein [Steroidobacteraceae bacterium]